jgi:hypothetical protein
MINNIKILVAEPFSQGVGMEIGSSTITYFCNDPAQRYFGLLVRSEEFIDLGNARINQQGGPLQGDLQGEYGTNQAHVLAVNLIWKF